MKVIDPGHRYELDRLDDYTGGRVKEELVFVKREGPKYPGNVGSHTGTTTQEVLRALIERSKYVNNQNRCYETERVIALLTESLCLLEDRAARLHGRPRHPSQSDIVLGRNKCELCGHCGCEGDCRHK